MARPTISTTFTATDKLTPSMKRMQKNVKGFGRFAQKSFGKTNDAVSRLTRRALALGATYLFGKGVKGIVGAAQMIEDATASFTPLMGSVEKATELVQRLNEEAATTPFQFKGIADVASQLLPVMNGSIEDTTEAFRMLGDTAGGNMQKLDSITRGYVKALLKGKPDMESLNMIAEAGVPIFTEMADSMGISVKQLMEMSKQGELTTDHLTGAFKQMTSEGGIFYKGMEVSSKTLSGKLSTLRDNLKLAAANVGKALLPVLKKLADRATEIIQKIAAWIKENQDLIQQKVENVVRKIGNALKWIAENGTLVKVIISTLIGLFIAYKVAMFAATIAQVGLNTAMAANPIGAIIVAIVALVSGIVWMVKNWDKVVKVLKKVWEFIKKVGKAIGGFFKRIGKWFKDKWRQGIEKAKAIWQGFTGFLKRTGGKIKGFFGKIGGWFKDKWQQGVENAKTNWRGFVDFVGNTRGKMIDLFSGWAEKIKGFFTGIKDKIVESFTRALQKIKELWDKIKGFFGGIGDRIRERRGEGAQPIGRNENVVRSQSVSESRSSVDVNIAGLPQGSTARQRGQAPGVNMNYGYAAAGLR